MGRIGVSGMAVAECESHPAPESPGTCASKRGLRKCLESCFVTDSNVCLCLSCQLEEDIKTELVILTMQELHSSELHLTHLQNGIKSHLRVVVRQEGGNGTECSSGISYRCQLSSWMTRKSSESSSHPSPSYFTHSHFLRWNPLNGHLTLEVSASPSLKYLKYSFGSHQATCSL